MVDKLVASMVEEMARAIEAELDLSVGLKGDMREDGDFDKAGRACAAIAQKRVNELEAERDKWKQRAFELEREHGDLKGVYVAALPTMLKGNGDG